MNADDPKFTAHILGESDDLTPAERVEIEALLAGDSSAAAEAAETRALAVWLRAELPAEVAAGLEEKQRAAVFEAARPPAVAAKVVRFPRRATMLALLAACVVVGISVGLIYQAMRVPALLSIPPLAAATSKSGNLSTDLAGWAGHEPPSSEQSVGTSAAPLIATGYADTGILKMASPNTGIGRGAEPHATAITDTNVNRTASMTMISTGAVSVNGGVTTFSSSTVTVVGTNAGLSIKGAIALPATEKSGYHDEFLELVKKAKSPAQ